MEKIAQEHGKETDTVQGETKCCIKLKTHARVLLHKGGGALKHFWSTNSSTFSHSKCYACNQ